MVSPHKIKYNDFASTEFSDLDLLVCVAFDGDSGEVSTFLNREAIASETYDGRYRRVYNYKYSEPFSPKFTFIKKDFGDFTMDEVRRVLKWLTSSSQPALLDVYYEHKDDNETADWSAVGGWVEISSYKAGNNRTIGVTATFEAVTPYAIKFESPNPSSKSISNLSDNKILVKINSDEPQKPIYPYVKIQHDGSIIEAPSGTKYDALSDMVPNTVYKSGDTYYWKSEERAKSAEKPTYNWEIVLVDNEESVKWEKNKIYYNQNAQMYYWVDPYYFHAEPTPRISTTSVRIRNKNIKFLPQGSEYTSTTIVKNNMGDETIIIDGVNRIITSEKNSSRIFGDDFNLQWVELYEGDNEITVEGNCTIEISWITPYKVGEW